MDGRVTTGWQTDPFGVHEARYFNADGQPTKLVRDRGVESFDEPPSGPEEVAAARARMSALPEPPRAYAPRGPYPSRYDPAAERARQLQTLGRVLAITGIILGVLGIGLGLYRLTFVPTSGEPPVPASGPPPTPATPATAATAGVAFVTQAATQTLQQRTVGVVLSTSEATGGTSESVRGTGAFDLAEQAGTWNMTMTSQGSVLALQEILLNGQAYVGVSVNGRSILPAGKAWVTEQVSTQAPGTPGLVSGDPAAALASLESQGITVRALGTKLIGGVSCTGYAVNAPGATAVWIDQQQHLVREITTAMTVGLPVGQASASAAATGATTAPSVILTMDFSYSAAPVHVTAPPAASTISYAAFLQQREQSPAS